jgi:hypothetical protein
MINDSKRLRSNHSGEWINHEENYKVVPNGKAKCFVCMKDHVVEENLEESDYMQIFLRSKSGNFSKSANTKQKYSNTDENQHLRINSTKNSPLLSPCKCDTVVHAYCLIQFVSINCSFQCSKCKMHFSCELVESPKTKSLYRCCLFTIISLMIFFHGSLYILSIFFFIGSQNGWSFIIDPNFFFWNFLVGITIIIINTLLLISSIKGVKSYLNNCHIKFPIFQNFSQNYVNEFNKSPQEKCQDFNCFLMNKHKSNKLELIEKKVNNVIFLETIIKDEMKISKFMSSSNNEFNLRQFTIREDGDKTKINMNEKLILNNNRFNPYSALKKQKTQEQSRNKPPIDKTSMLVKSKTKAGVDAKRDQYGGKKKMSLQEIQEEQEQMYRKEGTMQETEGNKRSSNLHLIYQPENSEANLLDGIDRMYHKDNISSLKDRAKISQEQNIPTKKMTKTSELTGSKSPLKNSAHYLNCDSIVQESN